MVRFDGDVTIVAQLGDDSSAGDTVRFGDFSVLRAGDRSASGPRLVGLE
jgi:hypothetical protein